MANAIKPKSTTTAAKVPAAGDLLTGEIAVNIADGVLFLKKADNTIATFEAKNGTVQSVAMSVPAGLTITGSPITTTGTLALTFTNGYAIPTTSSQATWDTGYSERRQWDGGSTNLNAATARTSLGLVIGTNVQAWDADLDSIAGLAGTSGLLKKTAANTWSLDTSAGVPTGSLFPFAGSSAPTGYLLCDGTAVLRATYATLFGVIGTTYGAGNGSTTFNLPDLRGRVPLGAGQGTGLTNRVLGATTGTETHTLSLAEIPSHNHGGATGYMSANASHVHNLNREAVSFWGSGGGYQLGTSPGTAQGWSGNPAVGATNTDHTHSIPSAGSGAGHNNMQPSVVANYLIKT